jgi:hypothetical protein
MKLKRDTEVISAESEFGRDIPVHVDSYGTDNVVWLGSDDPYGGVRAVIVADTWEEAYEMLIDELPTVPEDELHEAYGFDSKEEFDAAVAAADSGEGEYPELIDGRTYQSNCSGTGVVDTAYASIRPYDKNSDVRLTIGRI